VEVSSGREEGSGTDPQGMSAKMSRLQADALHEPLDPIAQLINRDGPTGAKTEKRLKFRLHRGHGPSRAARGAESRVFRSQQTLVA